jgi:hypothetical protein
MKVQNFQLTCTFAATPTDVTMDPLFLLGIPPHKIEHILDGKK